MVLAVVGLCVCAAAAGLNDAAEPAVNPPASSSSVTEFGEVLWGSGVFGLVIWIGLFAAAALTIYWSVDSAILVQEHRVMPSSLILNATKAARDGHVMQVLECCERDPCPLASIMAAGFSHIEDGPDSVQEAVTLAADVETERLAHELTWISVMSAVAPMLGLLGTVQGMIMAFKAISISSPDPNLLPMAIAQALWTTAAGLVIAIPALILHYLMKHKTSTTILKMEALTIQLVGEIRRVEVVPVQG